MKGDVDSDGQITINDAVTLRSQLIGLSGYNSPDPQVSDLDDDSSVTINDVVWLESYLVGLPNYPINQPDPSSSSMFILGVQDAQLITEDGNDKLITES